MEFFLRIVFFVGVGLLGLGGLAGAALFLRAVSSNTPQASWGVGTLWGLFIIGVVGGLVLLGLVFSR